MKRIIQYLPVVLGLALGNIAYEAMAGGSIKFSPIYFMTIGVIASALFGEKLK